MLDPVSTQQQILKIWLRMMNVGIYNNDDDNQQFSFTQGDMVEELTRQKEAEERHELRKCVRIES